MVNQEHGQPEHSRKKRANAACDFCRRRKLGCDNAKPKCSSCRTRGAKCTYTERQRQTRPSNARIHQLEGENDRLRQALHTEREYTTSPAVFPPLNGEIVPEDDREAILLTPHSAASDHRDEYAPSSHGHYPNLGREASQTRIQTRSRSSYHGPSSVLFDSGQGNSGSHNTVDDTRIGSMGALLIANTTRQRQLEMINAKAGKLDFDGVDASLGMKLFSIYWNRQNHECPVVYRPVFMRDMVSKGRYFSKLLLYAIFYAASKYSSDNRVRSDPSDPDTAGIEFRQKFEDILHEGRAKLLGRGEIATVQALLVVANVLISWRDETSLAWHYTGVAINMIIDLGIHIEPRATQSLDLRSAEELEVNRRTFWAAFVLDKIHSIYQGRFARLGGLHCKVPIDFKDDYEELELFRTVTYTANPKHLDTPTYSVTTFKALCQLSSIMDKIILKLYAEGRESTDAPQLFKDAMTLHHELRCWRSEMPAHLKIDLRNSGATAVLPHTLSLLAMYNALVILLHRPFVSEGHLHSVSSLTAREAFSHCVMAANEITRTLEVYDRHFCLTTVPYFISYATYVSATIHVRIAAQKGVDSEAGRCLRNCLQVLITQQAKCHAPRRTVKILKRLMEYLNVDIGTDSFAACSQEGNAGLSETFTAQQVPPARVDLAGGLHQGESPPSGRVESDESGFSSFLIDDLDMDDILKTFTFSVEGLNQTLSSNIRDVVDFNLITDTLENLDHGQSRTTVTAQSELLQDAEMRGFFAGNAAFPDALFGFDNDLV